MAKRLGAGSKGMSSRSIKQTSRPKRTSGRRRHEAEWLTGTDPTSMVDSLESLVDLGELGDFCLTNRKLILLRIAVLRRIEHLMPTRQTRAVITAIERYVERQCSARRLEEVKAKAYRSRTERKDKAYARANGLAWSAAVTMGDSIRHTLMTAAAACAEASLGAEGAAGIEEERAQANLVRDIFGNPFRPVALEPGWKSGAATSLAQAIYKDRAFDRMPILADALEEAGCTDPDILAHCRGGSEHVRGCWVVDLLTGRE